MTRNVHHHYEYAKDGHKRTYKMRVEVDGPLSLEAKSVFASSQSSRYTHIRENIFLSNFHYKMTSDGILLSTLPVNNEPISSNDSVVSLKEALAKRTTDEQPSASSEMSYLGKSKALLPLGAHPNNDNIVTVHLMRNTDSFPIPYTTIHGVTLISAIRLGLEPSLRER
jgi:hypothetical protein